MLHGPPRTAGPAAPATVRFSSASSGSDPVTRALSRQHRPARAGLSQRVGSAHTPRAGLWKSPELGRAEEEGGAGAGRGLAGGGTEEVGGAEGKGADGFQ